MKKIAIFATVVLTIPGAWADPAGEADAAVRAFFAKNGASGAIEMFDPAAGVKRLLTLPAQPEAIYSADKFMVVSYRAADARAAPVDLDVFVQGEDGEREVGLVYVSARPVVQDMATKGEIAKIR